MLWVDQGQRGGRLDRGQPSSTIIWFANLENHRQLIDDRGAVKCGWVEIRPRVGGKLFAHHIRAAFPSGIYPAKSPSYRAGHHSFPTISVPSAN